MSGSIRNLFTLLYFYSLTSICGCGSNVDSSFTDKTAATPKPKQHGSSNQNQEHSVKPHSIFVEVREYSWGRSHHQTICSVVRVKEGDQINVGFGGEIRIEQIIDSTNAKIWISPTCRYRFGAFSRSEVPKRGGCTVKLSTNKIKVWQPSWDAGSESTFRILDILQAPKVSADSPEIINSLSQRATVVVDQSGSVQELRNFQSKVTDDLVSDIAKLSNLRILDLAKTNISIKQLKALKPLTRLTSLNLARTNIGNEGLASLTSLKNLEELNLSYTKVNEAGVKTLHQFEYLEIIHLYEIELSNRVAWNLQLEFPACFICNETTESWGTLRYQKNGDFRHQIRVLYPHDFIGKSDQHYVMKLLLMGIDLYEDDEGKIFNASFEKFNNDYFGNESNAISNLTLLKHLKKVELPDLRDNYRMQSKLTKIREYAKSRKLEIAAFY